MAKMYIADVTMQTLANNAETMQTWMKNNGVAPETHTFRRSDDATLCWECLPWSEAAAMDVKAWQNRAKFYFACWSRRMTPEEAFAKFDGKSFDEIFKELGE